MLRAVICMLECVGICSISVFSIFTLLKKSREAGTLPPSVCLAAQKTAAHVQWGLGGLSWRGEMLRMFSVPCGCCFPAWSTERLSGGPWKQWAAFAALRHPGLKGGVSPRLHRRPPSPRPLSLLGLRSPTSCDLPGTYLRPALHLLSMHLPSSGQQGDCKTSGPFSNPVLWPRLWPRDTISIFESVVSALVVPPQNLCMFYFLFLSPT